VFICPTKGARTGNTENSRTELREKNADGTLAACTVTHEAVKPVDPPSDDFAKRLASLEATFYAYKALTDGRFDAIKKAVQ
jgi:hypothetical protein